MRRFRPYRESSISSFDLGGVDMMLRGLWDQANGSGGAECNDPYIRREMVRVSDILQKRSSDYVSIARRKAQLVIGNHLTIQIRDRKTGKRNDEAEHVWNTWYREFNGGDFLYRMRYQKFVVGEVFIFHGRRKKPSPRGFRYYPRLIPADSIACAAGDALRMDYVDGIHLDECEIPTAYDVITQTDRRHYWIGMQDTRKYQTVDAAYMTHLYDKLMERQLRGIPEIFPALRQAGFLHEGLKNVSSILQKLIAISGIVKMSSSDYIDEIEDENGQMQKIDDRPQLGGVMELPPDGLAVFSEDTNIETVEPKVPNTDIMQFFSQLRESMACNADISNNLARMNSTGLPYSAATLDHLSTHGSCEHDQESIDNQLLQPMWMHFYSDASETFPCIADIDPWETDIQFMFSAWKDIDSLKAANSAGKRMALGITSRRDEANAIGYDADEVDRENLQSIVRYKELIEETGMTVDEIVKVKSIMDGVLLPSVNSVNAAPPEDESGDEELDGDESTTKK